MVARMADKPLILALANPTPEITPDGSRRCSDVAIAPPAEATIRNQVNNVLCFPLPLRGALDCATTINDEMEVAAVHAIAELAQAETKQEVARAYGREAADSGPEYLIPSPFDPRLMIRVAPQR